MLHRHHLDRTIPERQRSCTVNAFTSRRCLVVRNKRYATLRNTPTMYATQLWTKTGRSITATGIENISKYHLADVSLKTPQTALVFLCNDYALVWAKVLSTMLVCLRTLKHWSTSDVVFNIRWILSWILWPGEYTFLMIQINNSRGDLKDVSTATLISVGDVQFRKMGSFNWVEFSEKVLRPAARKPLRVRFILTCLNLSINVDEALAVRLTEWTLADVLVNQPDNYMFLACSIMFVESKYPMHSVFSTQAAFSGAASCLIHSLSKNSNLHAILVPLNGFCFQCQHGRFEADLQLSLRGLSKSVLDTFILWIYSFILWMSYF